MLVRRPCLYAAFLVILAAPPARAHHGWGFGFASNPVYGGDTVTASLSREWSGNFITPGEFFTFATSNPDLVTVPPQVFLGDNVFQATFSVQTRPVAVQTEVTITAMRGFEPRSMTLTLMPLALKEITLERPRAVGGHTVTGTLHLYGPAPAGGLNVVLWSEDRAKATVPSRVVVPEGARSVQFPILTSLQFEVSSVTLIAEWKTQVSATLGLVPPPRYLVEDVSPLPGVRAEANAIADNGDVAGYTIPDYHRGFLWRNGTPTVLGLLMGNNSSAEDVNELGQVVGGSDRPFLWRDGIFQDLGGLGTSAYGVQYGTAYGVNDAGDVVGESFAGPDPNKGYHPFYKPYGKPIVDLAPASVSGCAQEINNGGRIVGWYTSTPNGNKVAFRARVNLSPEEPSTHLNGIANSPDVSLETVFKEGWNVLATDINTADEALIGMKNIVTQEAVSYVWKLDGTLKELPLGRLPGSRATALNDNGEVVGYHMVHGAPIVEFPFHLAPDGTITNLNDVIDPASGWHLFTPSDINNAGQIVGAGTINAADPGDPGEISRAYRLTPLLSSDIDRNGVTDLRDVTNVLRIAAGAAPAPPFGIGDMDADKRVTLVDAAQIARRMVTGP